MPAVGETTRGRPARVAPARARLPAAASPAAPTPLARVFTTVSAGARFKVRVAAGGCIHLEVPAGVCGNVQTQRVTLHHNKLAEQWLGREVEILVTACSSEPAFPLGYNPAPPADLIQAFYFRPVDGAPYFHPQQCSRAFDLDTRMHSIWLPDQGPSDPFMEVPLYKGFQGLGSVVLARVTAAGLQSFEAAANGNLQPVAEVTDLEGTVTAKILGKGADAVFRHGMDGFSGPYTLFGDDRLVYPPDGKHSSILAEDVGTYGIDRAVGVDCYTEDGYATETFKHGERDRPIYNIVLRRRGKIFFTGRQKSQGAALSGIITIEGKPTFKEECRQKPGARIREVCQVNGPPSYALCSYAPGTFAEAPFVNRRASLLLADKRCLFIIPEPRFDLFTWQIVKAASEVYRADFTDEDVIALREAATRVYDCYQLQGEEVAQAQLTALTEFSKDDAEQKAALLLSARQRTKVNAPIPSPQTKLMRSIPAARMIFDRQPAPPKETATNLFAFYVCAPVVSAAAELPPPAFRRPPEDCRAVKSIDGATRFIGARLPAEMNLSGIVVHEKALTAVHSVTASAAAGPWRETCACGPRNLEICRHTRRSTRPTARRISLVVANNDAVLFMVPEPELDAFSWEIARAAAAAHRPNLSSQQLARLRLLAQEAYDLHLKDHEAEARARIGRLQAFAGARFHPPQIIDVNENGTACLEAPAALFADEKLRRMPIYHHALEDYRDQRVSAQVVEIPGEDPEILLLSTGTETLTPLGCLRIDTNNALAYRNPQAANHAYQRTHRLYVVDMRANPELHLGPLVLCQGGSRLGVIIVRVDASFRLVAVHHLKSMPIVWRGSGKDENKIMLCGTAHVSDEAPRKAPRDPVKPDSPRKERVREADHPSFVSSLAIPENPLSLFDVPEYPFHDLFIHFPAPFIPGPPTARQARVLEGFFDPLLARLVREAAVAEKAAEKQAAAAAREAAVARRKEAAGRKAAARQAAAERRAAAAAERQVAAARKAAEKQAAAERRAAAAAAAKKDAALRRAAEKTGPLDMLRARIAGLFSQPAAVSRLAECLQDILDCYLPPVHATVISALNTAAEGCESGTLSLGTTLFPFDIRPESVFSRIKIAHGAILRLPERILIKGEAVQAANAAKIAWEYLFLASPAKAALRRKDASAAAALEKERQALLRSVRAIRYARGIDLCAKFIPELQACVHEPTLAPANGFSAAPAARTAANGRAPAKSNGAPKAPLRTRLLVFIPRLCAQLGDQRLMQSILDDCAAAAERCRETDLARLNQIARIVVAIKDSEFEYAEAAWREL